MINLDTANTYYLLHFRKPFRTFAKALVQALNVVHFTRSPSLKLASTRVSASMFGTLALRTPLSASSAVVMWVNRPHTILICTLIDYHSYIQLSLQLERSFERHKDGHFEPYVRQVPAQTIPSSKQRLVYTKLRLYMVKMLFDTEQKTTSGLLLSWTPDVLAKSHFGLMQVEFTLQTRSPT